MNHCVPDWDIEDAPIPSSSGFSRNVEKKSVMPDDELVELLWRNGQPVMHSQTQRSSRKSPENFPGMDAVPLDRPEKFISDHREDIRSAASHLFIQEDEMASWLHYPLDDSEFCTDLFNPIRGSAAGNVSGVRNPQIPVERKAVSVVAPVEKALPESSRPLNFQHFSLPGMSRRGFPADEVSGNAARVSRFGSDEIPARGSGNYASLVPELRISGRGWRGVSGSAVAHVSFNVGGVQMVEEGSSSKGCASSCAVTDAGAHTGEGIEATVSCSSTAEQNANTVADDRKRKARETDESECQSQEREFEWLDPKKVARQTSTSTRKTRAAEVHNLSERRRRDRINEKMKALQQLIPRCNKSDKASMLDDAIEYLKSLQLQVQMMSMGCSMPPMMFPGVQHYISPMGMGLGMGMGMEMPVGLNRPILSFPQVLTSSAGPGPAPPHLGPRIPVPAFHLHPIHQTDQSQVQATNRVNHALNMVNLQNLNQMQAQHIVDPYQHYIGLHPMQVTPQNQVPAQPSTAKGAEIPPECKSG